jgi:hypothetical protein
MTPMFSLTLVARTVIWIGFLALVAGFTMS